MKILKCRSCTSANLINAFNLGNYHLTGVFPSSPSEKIPKGFLDLVLCNSCKLLQLRNSFDPAQMYGDNYGYMSSLNLMMVNHLKNKKEKLNKIIKLEHGDIVCDIGSNDGTFLSFFSKNLKLIGIDPTIKKLSKFYRKDILKIDNFFSLEIVRKFILKKIKLITSMSMFYDVENPVVFANDIYELLDDNGIWHLEQSYMPMMIQNYSYDTICHEHLEYYSLRSIKYIFDKVGFKIIDLEFNGTNGGSFALTVSKKKSKYKEASALVNWLLYKEEIFKYNSVETFRDFFIKIQKHKKVFRNLLINLKDSKKVVVGYGASTKGNVILQFCKIDKNLLPYICDVNSYKDGRFTPGTNIKIVSEQKVKRLKPDYFLVLPWHFKNFIINKENNFLKKGGKLIFPMPDIEII